MFFARYGVPETNITLYSYKGHSLAYDNAKRIPVWVAELLRHNTLHHNKVAHRHQSHFKVCAHTQTQGNIRWLIGRPQCTS